MNGKNILNNMEHMCPLPWVGFSNDPYGSVKPCCINKDYIVKPDGSFFYVQNDTVGDIFHSEYMDNLRTQFLNGEKPKGCETCWKDEDNGYKSKRQIYIEILKNNGTIVDYGKVPEYPEDYQIILNNSCNLKCRSCSPSHSTSWLKEVNDIPESEWEKFGIRYFGLKHGQPGHQTSEFIESMDTWLPHVRRLEIVGGEPFYSNTWERVLTHMINEGHSKNILLNMSTNGTILNEDLMIKICEGFKAVGIGLSIDGTEGTFEYLRKNAIWDEVKENLFKYHELKKKYKNLGFTYTHTTSWVNAYELPKTIQWMRDNTPLFDFWLNIVHYPPHMSIYMLPKEEKDRIKSHWETFDFKEQTNDIKALIEFMYSKQPSEDELRKEYTKFTILDGYRNESTIDIVKTNYPTLVNYFM